jgi:hypothetical protein
MNLNEITQLEMFISRPRLLSYKVITGNENTSHLIGAYNWNKQVSTAIYPILQCLEVTLRNALNLEIKKHFNMSDWYNLLLKHGGDKKFTDELSVNPALDGNFFRNNISQPPRRGRKRWTSYHENMLKAAKRRLDNTNKSHSSNAIIAELMFGFWVGLFEQSYRDIDPQISIWPHIESNLFPNLSQEERKSSSILTKLIELKTLRNRLSHHEPIWKCGAVTDKNLAISYLNEIVNDALFIIKGISIERYTSLALSGKILSFRGVCSIGMLDKQIQNKLITKVDKRRLQREIRKTLSCNSSDPILINLNDVPILVVGLSPLYGMANNVS